MTDGTFRRPLSELLHELAERLHSAGNYLGAARKIRSHSTSEQALTGDMIDKAVGEIARAQTAFHRIREHLRPETRDEKDAMSVAVQTDDAPHLVGPEVRKSHTAD